MSELEKFAKISTIRLYRTLTSECLHILHDPIGFWPSDHTSSKNPILSGSSTARHRISSDLVNLWSDSDIPFATRFRYRNRSRLKRSRSHGFDLGRILASIGTEKKMESEQTMQWDVGMNMRTYVQSKDVEENNVENQMSKSNGRKNKYRKETCRKRDAEAVAVEWKYLEGRKHRNFLEALIKRCDVYISILKSTLTVRSQLISQYGFRNDWHALEHSRRSTGNGILMKKEEN